MPWKENTTMDLRVQLIQEYQRGREHFGAGRDYGVARKTIYKWLARHEAEGVAGLADRSRVPQHFPGSAQRGDGRADRRRAPSLALGAAEAAGEAGRRRSGNRVARRKSTIGEVLKRAGLTHPRKPRVRTPPYGPPFASVDAANQTWCADYKGHFRTGDGTRCDPLTITDAHSRYLLRCHITPKCRRRARGRGVRRLLSRARTAAGDPYRQRHALRQPRAGRPQPRVDGVGEAGHCAGAFAARFAAG